MKKRTSFVARIIAALALAGAVLAVVLVVSAGVKDDSSSKQGDGNEQTTTQPSKPERTKAATYTVRSGDTLIGIAHKTGVPLAEIQALNPEVDPQILTEGEKLKLR